MPTDTIFREVMMEYERDRDAAMRLSDERRRELYEAVPRIKEIEEEMSRTAPAIIKKLLMGQAASTESCIEELSGVNLRLQTEKKELMEKAGYPLDYVQNVYKCRMCNDTGYTDDRQRCKCLLQRLITKRYIMSSLDKTLDKENFSTFNMDYYSGELDERAGLSPRENSKLILNTCMKFVSNFGKTFSNLLLYGNPGLGKTFICNCIAKELLDAGHSVLYATAPQLFKRMEDSRFNKNYEEEADNYIDLAIDSDLLIIDDLGTEFVTVVTQSGLFDLINTRFLNRKPVIISTNLPGDSLKEHYSERITSRITGSYTMLKFFGDDIRTIKKYR